MKQNNVPVTVTSPRMEVSTLYLDMLNAGHMLIAGAQGSGKSTVMSGLIHTALYMCPNQCRMVIIDPKRVDMVEYRDLPHVMRYATEPAQIAEALQATIDVMENRYNDMARRGLKMYDGTNLFVFVDELADLMTDPRNKRTFTPMLQRLAQLGRAARVTVIGATQCCLASVLSTAIKCNFPSRLALRTASAQDSRNILDMKGAEQLPDPRTAGVAHGIWRNGANTQTWVMHRYDDAERQRVIDWWMIQKRMVIATQQPQQKPRRLFGIFGRKSA